MNKDIWLVILIVLFIIVSWIFDLSSETQTAVALIICVLIAKNWVESMIENSNARTQSLKLDLEQIKQVLWRIEDNLKK